ncbi:MAG: hypothetical protein ACOYNM_19035, partial [Gemmataceae bacterium]
MKRTLPDAGDAVWHRDASDRSFVEEGIRTNGYDGQAANSRWNSYRTTSTRIPGDGNSAIACRKVKTS